MEKKQASLASPLICLRTDWEQKVVSHVEVVAQELSEAPENHCSAWALAEGKPELLARTMPEGFL